MFLSLVVATAVAGCTLGPDYRRPAMPVRDFLAGQEALLAPGLGSATAARQAVARAYGVLIQQATFFAYVDTFRWLAILCFLSVPLALLLRRVTRGRGPVAAHQPNGETP